MAFAAKKPSRQPTKMYQLSNSSQFFEKTICTLEQTLCQAFPFVFYRNHHAFNLFDELERSWHLTFRLKIFCCCITYLKRHTSISIPSGISILLYIYYYYIIFCILGAPCQLILLIKNKPLCQPTWSSPTSIDF